MVTNFVDALIHPASRSDLFKSKSFTENIITNIVKVCSPKKSFVIDDNDFKSAFYDENNYSTEVLAIVINGYYIEIPKTQATGVKYFYIDTTLLGYDSGSPFVGMKEAVATMVGDAKCFVFGATDRADIPEGIDSDDILEVSPNGIDWTAGNDGWDSFYLYVLKNSVYNLSVAGAVSPT